VSVHGRRAWSPRGAASSTIRAVDPLSPDEPARVRAHAMSALCDADEIVPDLRVARVARPGCTV